MIGRGSAERGPVLLLTGPAASGKSTVARLIADASAAPSVLLAGDFFAHSLRSGRLRGWEPGAEPQNEIVVEATAEAAAAYAAGGYFVVVDAMIRPAFLGIFLEPLLRRRVEVHYVVLRPPFAVVLARSRDRPTVERHDETVLARIHSYFDDLHGRDTHIVDNSSQRPDDTVAEVGAALASGRFKLNNDQR